MRSPLISYQVPILPSLNSINRKSWGHFSMLLVSAFSRRFWPLQRQEYAALGILVMTWGDGLAAVIGQKYGKHIYRVWGIQKSWEGSATMYLVSFAISSLILLAVQGNIWQTGLRRCCTLAAATLESVSSWELTISLCRSAVLRSPSPKSILGNC